MGLDKESRSGADRRQEDRSPPKRIEQRKRAEARKSEIAEIELSEDEWNTHFGSYRGAASTMSVKVNDTDLR